MALNGTFFKNTVSYIKIGKNCKFRNIIIYFSSTKQFQVSVCHLLANSIALANVSAIVTKLPTMFACSHEGLDINKPIVNITAKRGQKFNKITNAYDKSNLLTFRNFLIDRKALSVGSELSSIAISFAIFSFAN